MRTVTEEWYVAQHKAIMQAVVKLDAWWNQQLEGKSGASPEATAYMDDAERWIGERRTALRNVEYGEVISSETVRTIQGDHRLPTPPKWRVA